MHHRYGANPQKRDQTYPAYPKNKPQKVCCRCCCLCCCSERKEAKDCQSWPGIRLLRGGTVIYEQWHTFRSPTEKKSPNSETFAPVSPYIAAWGEEEGGSLLTCGGVRGVKGKMQFFLGWWHFGSRGGDGPKGGRNEDAWIHPSNNGIYQIKQEK